MKHGKDGKADGDDAGNRAHFDPRERGGGRNHGKEADEAGQSPPRSQYTRLFGKLPTPPDSSPTDRMLGGPNRIDFLTMGHEPSFWSVKHQGNSCRGLSRRASGAL